MTARASGKFGGVLLYWEMVNCYITSSFDHSIQDDAAEEETKNQSDEEVGMAEVAQQSEEAVQELVANINEQAQHIFTAFLEGNLTVADALKSITKAPREMIIDLYSLM